MFATCTLDFVGLGPHAENSRKWPSFCCHDNNYSHFSPIYNALGALHACFSDISGIFDLCLHKMQVSLKDVLIFLLTKQVHKFKMADFEKIRHNLAKFKLFYL